MATTDNARTRMPERACLGAAAAATVARRIVRRPCGAATVATATSASVQAVIRISPICLRGFRCLVCVRWAILAVCALAATLAILIAIIAAVACSAGGRLIKLASSAGCLIRNVCLLCAASVHDSLHSCATAAATAAASA